MKHLNIILLVVISSAITSSSCQMLQGLLGGLGGGGDGNTFAPNNNLPGYVGLTGDAPTGELNLSSGSSNKIGYVARSSAPAHPNADGGHLYGVFKAD